MESILTLKKDYSDKTVNLLFKSKVTVAKVQATIYKMLYSFEYNDFFELNDKYNVTVTVNELHDGFSIVVNTDDDYLVLSLSELEVISVSF